MAPLAVVLALLGSHGAHRVRHGSARIAMGAKKRKAHFEAYTIPDRPEAGPFPPPDRRDAVRVASRHLPAGAKAGKAPPAFLDAYMPGFRTDTKGLRILHLDPPVLLVEGFMTGAECKAVRELVGSGKAYETPSATFSTLTRSVRTSTTWYVHHTDVAPLCGKVAALLGVDPCTLEEPQIVRYAVGQRFGWHYDAVPKAQLDNGGQRRATVLVVLAEPTRGGATGFRDLDGLSVPPRLGNALVFFPSDADGVPDERTLHAGQLVQEGEKWIAQIWVHERQYKPCLPPGAAEDAAMRAAESWTGAGGAEAPAPGAAPAVRDL